MVGRLHALLIGIDAYDGGGMLSGCVNDVDTLQRLLVDQVGVARECITRLVAPRTGAVHETDVPHQVPTGARIRAAFETLCSERISSEDRIFVYYAGHGTQCIVEDSRGRRFSREAILPKDKVDGLERRFLFDWEFNMLLSRASARAAAVTVVLDCCCSAGVTRGTGSDAGAQARFWRTEGVQVLAEDTPPNGHATRGIAHGIASAPGCIVLAACRDDERAHESSGADGRTHGELTRVLVRHLNKLSRTELQDVRWGQVWRAVCADVRGANPRQSPWMSGGFGQRIFGPGPPFVADTGISITADSQCYRLDAGSLAGVTLGALVAVYGETPATFPPLASAEEQVARCGLLEVTTAGLASSEAKAVEPFVLPAGARGRLVRAGDGARLRVALSPFDRAAAAALAASQLLELATDRSAELELVHRADNSWVLTDDLHGHDDGEPVLAAVPSNSPQLLRRMVEHYHAYAMPLRMARATSHLLCPLKLWLLDCNGASVSASDAQSPDLPPIASGSLAPYEIAVGDRLCFVVANTSSVALSVSLINCAASGKVQILGEKRLPAQTEHVFWSNDTLGAPFVATIQPHAAVGIDRLVALATERADVSLAYMVTHLSFASLAGSRGSQPKQGGASVVPLRDEHVWTSVMTAVRITRAANRGR